MVCQLPLTFWHGLPCLLAALARLCVLCLLLLLLLLPLPLFIHQHRPHLFDTSLSPPENVLCATHAGKASITGTVYMMNFLPTTLLISKICPDGVETTTFAMLAGVSNFGQQVAGYGECT